MRYSYEYKKLCVEMYRQGKWPETPVGVKQKSFHLTIRKWTRMEEACGPEVLHHKSQNAEIAVVKKEIALREERRAAQLKAKKLRSSKNSAKKDTD